MRLALVEYVRPPSLAAARSVLGNARSRPSPGWRAHLMCGLWGVAGEREIELFASDGLPSRADDCRERACSRVDAERHQSSTSQTRDHRTIPGDVYGPGGIRRITPRRGLRAVQLWISRPMCGIRRAVPRAHRRPPCRHIRSEGGQIFLTHTDRIVERPMRGLYLFSEDTTHPKYMATRNVSDLFLTRYERVGRSIDPVLAHALEFGKLTYNLGLMPLDRWLNTSVYRKAAYLHCFRQVVIAPIIVGGRAVGTVNVGDTDTVSEIDDREIDIITLVTRCLSIGLRELAHGHRLRHGARLTADAFDQAPIPMALTRADARAPRLNAAAKDLLRNTDEVSAVLQLLARPDDQPSFIRNADVIRHDGSHMRLRGVSKPVGCPANALLTTMQRLDTAPVAAALAVLTPREREVAQLAANDLTDAEIAAKLHISVYTVGQHLKRTYRKLGVHTRVGLTRLTLGSSNGAL